MRDPVCATDPARIALARTTGAAATDREWRHFARPRSHAAARQPGCGAAPGRIPVESVQALSEPWLFTQALQPAHDPRRDRQLSRAHARNSESSDVAVE